MVRSLLNFAFSTGILTVYVVNHYILIPFRLITTLSSFSLTSCGLFVAVRGTCYDPWNKSLNTSITAQCREAHSYLRRNDTIHCQVYVHEHRTPYHALRFVQCTPIRCSQCTYQFMCSKLYMLYTKWLSHPHAHLSRLNARDSVIRAATADTKFGLELSNIQVATAPVSGRSMPVSTP